MRRNRCAQVSDTEIDLMLKNGGGNRDELHLGHIQVTLPEGANSEQIAAAQAKADEVDRQIQGGMDFAAAAIRYSDAQNALDGGDLGWRGYNELPTAFSEIADKLAAGDAIILVESSGIHANGISFVRHLYEKNPKLYKTELSDGRLFGEAILTPTHLYVSRLRSVLRSRM